MALKRDFNDHERYGLTDEEYRLARRYLRRHKTQGALTGVDAAQLYELFLLGDSFQKLAQHFPQFPIGQIILTAALKGWCHDRDKMLITLQERVRAKVIKNVLDQVDFLTTMMAVTNAEHLDAMNKYVLDPRNNPKPALRIESIKEYKEISETLCKVVAGATSPRRPHDNSPMFAALTSPIANKSAALEYQDDEEESDAAQEVKEDSEDDLSILDAE